jgi:Domain of unknown function (DUF4126)
VDPGTAIASAWSAGISMYGVAALLGIAGRLDWVESPAWLQEWWVIAIATVLFAVEFVVDKVAAVDSLWDAVHTFLRPLAGAVLLGGADLDTATILAATVGGALAFSSHAAKATLRGLVNTSPEPVSNVVVSLAEDGLVAVLMAVAFANPELAVPITLVLTVASVVTTIVLFRFLRRAWRGVVARWRGPIGAG